MVIKSASEVMETAKRLIVAAGTPPPQAEIVAQYLVSANLSGHDSHGIQQLPAYLRLAQSGCIVAKATPSIVKESDTSALVRGNWAWGSLTAQFMTDLAISKAAGKGIATASAVECNHIGRLGGYVERAALQGAISILVSGGHGEPTATATIHGSAEPFLAPNPIAMGFPVADGPPIVLDFATTKVAMSKVILAKNQGRANLPEGWIVNARGEPSVNPDDLLSGGGALLPFGEHKGSALMIACEILGRFLSGADDYFDGLDGGPYSRRVGPTIIVIDANIYGSAGTVEKRTADFAARARKLTPAPGIESVMVPGDYEEGARRERTNRGVEIPDLTWQQLVDAGHELGIDLQA